MNCFVTGGTGFIGANLIHELNARGHKVRALVRKDSDRRGLEGADYEAVEGDLLEEDLAEKIKGCQWCFHVAASYYLWLKDYRPMYRTNVEGTRNVLTAAGKAGCSRIIYTSTVGCVGLPNEFNGMVIPADESAVAKEAEMSNHYKRSKWQAELAAMELVKAGKPIVIVNPTAPVGPRDVKPTPTGQVIVDFLRRKIPAFLDTGLNFVHVRDVAAGHILAAEKGRQGERYILGNADGNWTLQEALHELQSITEIPAPKRRISYEVAYLAAVANEGISKMTGKPPRAPLAGVRMAKHKMFFNPQKAIKELGLPQTPPRQALADAVEWFRANKYAE